MKKFFLIVIIIAAVGALTGCTNRNVQYEASGTKLNTYVKITLYGCGSQKIADKALEMCDYYENIFSRTIESSNLYILNEKGSMDIDTEEDRILADLINIGIEYGTLTDGALDITIEPVSSLWNFGNDEERVPSQEELDKALSKVDYKNIEITKDSINLNGARLDLGATAKGYIADRIKDYLEENGVDSAIISLGGNVLCIGNKPDNSNFNIGIQRPFGGSNDILTGLSIDGYSVVTSGVYERYFYEDNVFYHHILNPDTGYPCDNEMTSITIIARSSTECDCLSTGCFVLGPKKAVELIDSLSDTYAIWVDKNNEMHFSEGADKFIK